LRASQVGQPMMVTITRVERGRAAVVSRAISDLNGPLDASLPRRAGHASSGRSTPPEHHSRRARRPAHGRGTGRRGRRCAPIFAGAVTATPPARPPERDGSGRRFWSSSRSRRHPRRGDRDRVNVSATLPSQRMAHPPALHLQPSERALDVFLRAGTNPTAASQRQPMARVQAQHPRGEEQTYAEESSTRARRPQTEQRNHGAADRRFAGAREPAVLLAPCIVHAMRPYDHGSSSSALARAAASSSHFG
jgi:hypothetical protein